MTRLINVTVDGLDITVEQLPDGTFRKPAYLTGAEREVSGAGRRAGRESSADLGVMNDDSRQGGAARVETAPAPDDAARWSGWGTALKPAWEPIVVARKPFAGTVAANVTEHGTGALNIDGCRVNPGELIRCGGNGSGNVGGIMGPKTGSRPRVEPHNAGRWPPNVLLTHSAGCVPAGTRKIAGNIRPGPTVQAARENVAKGAERERVRGPRGVGNPDGTETVEVWDCGPGCPVAELDRQSGVLTSGANPARRGTDRVRDAYGEFAGQQECAVHRGADAGGASRFFPAFRWQAKAPASERPRLEDGTAHPTVKPLELMRWLVRLVTPPGGTVGDFFAGSGTTGEACLIEGFNCVLVEKDPASAELIKRRLSKPIQPVMFGEAG